MKKILIAGYSHQTKNYVNALIAADALAYTSLYEKDIDVYDGLILPGGTDIHPSFFHQSNMGSKNIDIELDKKQFAVLDNFIRLQKPVLGICKGMQIINVYFGGGIIQDLPTASVHAWNKKDMHHLTRAHANSFIHDLYGSELITNSAHHQGIGQPGKHIIPVQFALDNVTEAITHTSLPVIGVQWHPERMPPYFETPNIPHGSKIFHYFLDTLMK